MKPGGILIYDGYGIINPPTRKDIKVYRIDAMDAANEMNNAKAFNMIVLGGLLKLRPIVTLENVIKGLKENPAGTPPSLDSDERGSYQERYGVNP